MKIFDAHLHIIDPAFPLISNNGYLPEPFSCDDYLQLMGEFRPAGGAVVSGSFQGFDQSYLLAALEKLGPSFCGVTQIPATTSDQEIIRLAAGGVRAVRFNLKRGGSEEVGQLDRLARRVYQLAGWHTELYADSCELEALFTTVVALPAVSIDHLGLSKAGFATLLRLAEQGVRIKATGFGRVDFEVAPALRAIHSANPDALMFGSDLPSTRAPRPYSHADLQLLIDSLGEAAAAKVLYENGAAFYKTLTR